jgi:release factor glutamine methyltransferase
VSEVEVYPAPTVEEELDAAASKLRQAGFTTPRQEALELWAAVSGATPGAAWIQAKRPAAPDLLVRFREAVRRRAAGEPLQYAAGVCGFRTLDLAIDHRALIPRPETEGLVELVLEWAEDRWRAVPQWGDALDLGTGSGCIALSLTAEGRFRRIVATDISADALDLAATNRARLCPSTPVELRLGDWFEAVRGERFDVIVSNPPYIARGELGELERSVRQFEPQVALDGGVDGMLHIEAILREARGYLREGGLLAIEIDARRSQAALEAARERGWKGVRLEVDLWGRPRYLLAQPGGEA